MFYKEAETKTAIFDWKEATAWDFCFYIVDLSASSLSLRRRAANSSSETALRPDSFPINDGIFGIPFSSFSLLGLRKDQISVQFSKMTQMKAHIAKEREDVIMWSLICYQLSEMRTDSMGIFHFIQALSSAYTIILIIEITGLLKLTVVYVLYTKNLNISR